MNYRKMAMLLLLVSSCGMSQIASATEENSNVPENTKEETSIPVIDTDTFEQWVIVALAQREDSGKYLKVSDKTVNLMAVDKAVQYFNTKPLQISNGGQIKFTFKAEGSGQGQIGFFAYKDEKWEQVEGNTCQNFMLMATPKEYKFTLPVKGDAIKAIRVLIGAAPNSNVKYSELKINIK